MKNSMLGLVKGGYRFGRRLAILTLVAIGSLVMGAGAGYLGRPAVEQHAAAPVKYYTGVDLAPKNDVEVSADQAVLKDGEEVIVFGIGPDGHVLVQLPNGLSELVASGATHLVTITITKRGPMAYSRVGVLIPQYTAFWIGIADALEYSCSVTEVVYPEGLEEGEDRF